MKIGLALGGGGVKGMAHLGVLRVLEGAHVQIDIICGSSAGAMVGALYASGLASAQIQALARSLSFRQWFGRDKTGMGLFSTEGIRHILDHAIGEDTKIEDLQRPFMCVAVDLDSQKEVVLDSGPVADAVCASMAYPGLFAPVRIGDRMLFDGGVLNPVPFDIMRRYGADRVIAVDLGAPEPFFATLDSDAIRRGGVLWQLLYNLSHQQIFRVVERSLGIMAQELRNHKLADSPPDLIIYPRVRQVGLLDFGLIETCFAEGDAAAREMLPEIEKLVAPESGWMIRQGWRRFFEWARRIFPIRRWSDF
ncbi:MAG: patatin-like phospholipase family protein [Acidobacteriota bacterium]